MKYIIVSDCITLLSRQEQSTTVVNGTPCLYLQHPRPVRASPFTLSVYQPWENNECNRSLTLMKRHKSHFEVN